MNPVNVALISALLSAVFGTISSHVVYRVKFSHEEERYQKRKIESWEDEALQELESARQILIDITTRRGRDLTNGLW